LEFIRKYSDACLALSPKLKLIYVPLEFILDALENIPKLYRSIIFVFEFLLR